MEERHEGGFGGLITQAGASYKASAAPRGRHKGASSRGSVLGAETLDGETRFGAISLGSACSAARCGSLLTFLLTCLLTS